MSDIILEFKNISKSFGGIHALTNVSLQVRRGKVLGLIGENGAGKTTLMNVLGGNVVADEGEMILNGETYSPQSASDAIASGVGFIHQELNLFTNLSVAENIFIDGFPRNKAIPFFIDKRKMADKAAPLLKSINLDISPHTAVDMLSPGQRQLVEIVKSLALDAEIIIFDEPTTSLTAKETQNLFNLIKDLQERGKTVIYISHILGEIRELADDMVVLRDGKLVGSGKAEDFTVHKMISMMVGREIENLYPEKNSSPSDETLLSIEGVSQTGIVKDISFEIKKGEILGIFGLMGSGRTELARIIFGLDPLGAGEVQLRGESLEPMDPILRIKKGMAFVTEDRRDEGLLLDVSIAENLGLVSLRDYTQSLVKIINDDKMVEDGKNIKQTLQIKSDAIEKAPAKSLSGGNQQKVVIGKWLMSNPSAVILDEATRGIDVGAKYEVYTIMNDLAKDGTAILTISSEIEELIAMCDRILVMNRGEITGSFNRDEFDEKRILAAAFRESEAMLDGKIIEE